MDKLNIEDVKDLLNERSGNCVSIYMPTFRKGADVEQNRIRFKNNLREAEKILVEKEPNGMQALELLRPALKLVEDADFWNNQLDGLAVFIARNEFLTYRLPVAFTERCVVTRRFYVKPLLRVFSNDGPFYVLSLDQNNLRLFRATNHSIENIELKNIPTNMEDAIRLAEAKAKQFHTVERGANSPAIYNGPGYGTDDMKDKKDLLRFFQRIDQGIVDVLKGEGAPLILAGVEYLLPIYKEANSYTNLVDARITGNPSGFSEPEMHRKALEVMQPYFNKRVDNALEKFGNYVSSARGSDDIAEVVRAAYSGRIDILFINPQEHVWGSFNPDTFEVTIMDKAAEGAEDLTDFAALHTVLNNGIVYTLDLKRMPNGRTVAACFRY